MNSETGEKEEYRKLFHGKEKKTWHISSSNEFGRLAQGNGRVDGTNTIFFIPISKIPKGRSATYGRFVTDIKPNKEETHRVRLTVGGDRIDYPGDLHTPTADLTTAKLLFNSVISTPKARFMA